MSYTLIVTIYFNHRNRITQPIVIFKVYNPSDWISGSIKVADITLCNKSTVISSIRSKNIRGGYCFIFYLINQITFESDIPIVNGGIIGYTNLNGGAHLNTLIYQITI